MTQISENLVPLFSIILFFVGVYFSHLSLKKSNDHDPSYIVIDEWVGQWVALSFIPVNLNFAIAGFILFRFFDITKIGPVKYFEKIPGALGVMSDDIAAGLMSAFFIFIARIIFGSCCLSMIISIIFFIVEIQVSTNALKLHMSDMDIYE